MEHEPSARLGCRKCTVGATKSTLAGSNAPLSHRYCCLERKAKCPAVTAALKGTQGKGHGCAFLRQREKSPFTAARCASFTVFRTPPRLPTDARSAPRDAYCIAALAAHNQPRFTARPSDG